MTKKNCKRPRKVKYTFCVTSCRNRISTMDDSSQVIEYNASCSLDISIFILSRQNSAILYIAIGVGNILFSLTALVGNTVILLALRHCTSLHPLSKSLFFTVWLYMTSSLGSPCLLSTLLPSHAMMPNFSALSGYRTA